MSTVVILGAGPIGGTLAATLAFSETCARVVLADDAAAVAEGKALDVLQACPIATSDTRVTAAESPDAAAAADVVVVADRASDGLEWQGEAGLAAVGRLIRTNTRAPVVFAGTSQGWLLERAAAELGRPRSSLVGSVALAFESAVRAITALEADRSPGDVNLRVLGRLPDAPVIGWDTACIAGEPALERLDAAAVRRIEARLPALWPPAPYALASAAAQVVAALLTSSRRVLTCWVLATGAGAPRAWPVLLDESGVSEVGRPALDARLRSRLET